MDSADTDKWIRLAAFGLLTFDGLAIALFVLVSDVGARLLGLPSLTASLGGLSDSLFATSSVQALWYVTRAAGLTAYLLLWLSTIWGLLVSTKIFDGVLGRLYTYDFHQFLSLLAIGFTFAHVAVLLGDRYLPFSVAQILIPFASTYRPFWTGVGTIAFYLVLLVTVTFYLRKQIGVERFRAIHVLSLLGYFGATVHGLLAGTDSVLPSTQFIYFSTFFVFVFLSLFWLVRTKNSGRPLPDVLAPSTVQANRILKR